MRYAGPLICAVASIATFIVTSVWASGDYDDPWSIAMLAGVIVFIITLTTSWLIFVDGIARDRERLNDYAKRVGECQ